MPALDLSTDKLIATGTGSLDGAVPVDARVVLTRLLIQLGYNQIVIASTPPAVPANARNLWWDKGVNAVKRYNPLTSQWVTLTANQHVLHLFQRAAFAAGTDTVVETGDLFYMFDVSRDELRTISEATLRGLISNEIVGALSTSATELVIDLTELDTNRLYQLYFVGVFSQSGYIVLRCRTSSNANMDMIRHVMRYNQAVTISGESVVSGGSATTNQLSIAPQISLAHSESPGLVPFQLNFAKTGSPARVSMSMTGGVGYDPVINAESRANASAVAKLHFTIPTGVAVHNAKLIQP